VEDAKCETRVCETRVCGTRVRLAWTITPSSSLLIAVVRCATCLAASRPLAIAYEQPAACNVAFGMWAKWECDIWAKGACDVWRIPMWV